MSALYDRLVIDLIERHADKPELTEENVGEAAEWRGEIEPVLVSDRKVECDVPANPGGRKNLRRNSGSCFSVVGHRKSRGWTSRRQRPLSLRLGLGSQLGRRTRAVSKVRSTFLQGRTTDILTDRGRWRKRRQGNCERKRGRGRCHDPGRECRLHACKGEGESVGTPKTRRA